MVAATRKLIELDSQVQRSFQARKEKSDVTTNLSRS